MGLDALAPACKALSDRYVASLCEAQSPEYALILGKAMWGMAVGAAELALRFGCSGAGGWQTCVAALAASRHGGYGPHGMVAVAGGALGRLGPRLQYRPVAASLITLALRGVASAAQAHHLFARRHTVGGDVAGGEAVLLARSMASVALDLLSGVWVASHIGGGFGVALLTQLGCVLRPKPPGEGDETKPNHACFRTRRRVIVDSFG
jgi:hypothetical protein